MTKFTNICLLLILILAFLLRFYKIAEIPPSLNWDEVSHGYNAYSILKTGLDEWGQLPIANFRAYGDYPTTLYMYLTIPWVALFGLSELTVRLTSVIFGTLMVLVTYYLTKQFIKRDSLVLLAAFLVAISPWTLLTSRQTLQATPAIFFLSLGVLLFLKGIVGSRLLTLWGTFCMGVSAYAYHNTRILAPLILIILASLYLSEFVKEKKIFFLNLILGSIFFIPLIYFIFLGGGAARSVWVGILDQGAISRINEQRAKADLPDPLPRIFYNKATYFIITSISNYIGYFSPQFLVVGGGTHYQFSTPGFGVIYWAQLLLFYEGLIFLCLRFKFLSTDKKFLLLWLLAAPLPAAITRDSFQVVRALTMIPAIFIISVLGLEHILKVARKLGMKVILISLFIILTTNFIFYIDNLFNHYPKDYSFAWQYGYKEIADFITLKGDQYREIYITKRYGEPHEFLLFYTRFDPLKYRSDPNLVRYERSNWFWIDSFDKYKFVNDWEVKEKVNCGERKCLLITSPENYPEKSKIIKRIYFLDGKAAFDIVEPTNVQ